MILEETSYWESIADEWKKTSARIGFGENIVTRLINPFSFVGFPNTHFLGC